VGKIWNKAARLNKQKRLTGYGMYLVLLPVVAAENHPVDGQDFANYDQKLVTR